MDASSSPLEISFGVVGHFDRGNHAIDLATQLTAAIEIDDGPRGSLYNHDCTWRSAAAGSWTCVIEDDAILLPNFVEHAHYAVAHAPQRAALSLYTGTSRPFSRQVTRAVNEAETHGASWLSSNRLLWGVAVILPTELVTHMLQEVLEIGLPYDQRLSLWLRRHGIPCFYTVPSLVDHEDGPSLIRRHSQPRKAHRFHEPTSWNRKFVPILHN